MAHPVSVREALGRLVEGKQAFLEKRKPKFQGR